MSTLEKTKTDSRLKRPSLWKVMILNDDFTPMDYVMACLMEVFNKSEKEAYSLMMAVHQQGKGIAGVYPHSIAVEKKNIMNSLSKNNGHPLTTEIEEE